MKKCSPKRHGCKLLSAGTMTAYMFALHLAQWGSRSLFDLVGSTVIEITNSNNYVLWYNHGGYALRLNSPLSYTLLRSMGLFGYRLVVLTGQFGPVHLQK